MPSPLWGCLPAFAAEGDTLYWYCYFLISLYIFYWVGESCWFVCSKIDWQCGNRSFKPFSPEDPPRSSLLWRQSICGRVSGTKGQQMLLQINLWSKTPIQHGQNSFTGEVLERNHCPKCIRVSPVCPCNSFWGAGGCWGYPCQGTNGDAEPVPCTSAAPVPASRSCCPQSPREKAALAWLSLRSSRAGNFA